MAGHGLAATILVQAMKPGSVLRPEEQTNTLAETLRRQWSCWMRWFRPGVGHWSHTLCPLRPSNRHCVRLLSTEPGLASTKADTRLKSYKFQLIS